jgi:nitrate reductase delta subunit
MGLFEKHAPRPMARTLRVLARLLGYPDADLRAHLPELRAALHAEQAVSAQRLAELDALVGTLARRDALDVEGDYVQLFDSGRRTALHLFEHVHGDSRDRGPAMIDLAQTYEKAGLYLAEGEMPDHLPVVLEFASTQPPREAAAFLGEIAHLVNTIFAALDQRQSRYASVMGALLDLAGVPAQAGAGARRGVARRQLERAGRLRWLHQRRPGPRRPHPTRSHRPPRPVRAAGSHRMNATLTTFLFVVYPYVCLGVFVMGSLTRFDRDQYTWKSDSSQLLRAGQLRWGSNLFHGGILFLFFGHLFGQLTPHAVYEIFITAPQKQLLAIIAGGVAGLACFVGLTMLLHRRLFDPRIRLTSHRTDIAILIILWVQLVLGLTTLPPRSAMCPSRRPCCAWPATCRASPPSAPTPAW